MINSYFSYIEVVSFIGGENRSIRKKPPPPMREAVANNPEGFIK
jgi:hypothetical protein